MSQIEEVEIPYTLKDRDVLMGIRADVKTLLQLKSRHEARISRLETFRTRLGAIAAMSGILFGWILPAVGREAIRHLFKSHG